MKLSWKKKKKREEKKYLIGGISTGCNAIADAIL